MCIIVFEFVAIDNCFLETLVGIAEELENIFVQKGADIDGVWKVHDHNGIFRHMALPV
jgi:hypothetical protein